MEIKKKKNQEYANWSSEETEKYSAAPQGVTEKTKLLTSGLKKNVEFVAAWQVEELYDNGWEDVQAWNESMEAMSQEVKDMALTSETSYKNAEVETSNVLQGSKWNHYASKKYDYVSNHQSQDLATAINSANELWNTANKSDD